MINNLVSMWGTIETALSKVVEFMSHEINFDWINKLPDWLANTFGVIFPENITVFELMLGGGLTFVLTYTLVKWFTDIIA